MVLHKILRKVKREDKNIRILVLGLDNAGKTTIVRRLNGEDIDSVAPTLGFKITSFSYEPFTVNIWDVGGQKSIRTYWKNYFESTDGLIWVVDSADLGKMQVCAKELHDLLKEEPLAGASLLVLSNKVDLEGALTSQEIEQALDLRSIKTHDWTIEPVSAVTNKRVVEAFTDFIRSLGTKRGGNSACV